MNFEDNSLPRTGNQSGGNNSLAPSTRFESSRPATGDLIANQGPSQVSIDRPSNSDRPVEVTAVEDFQANGLLHRHRYGVEEEQQAPGTVKSNGIVGSPNFHTVHITDEGDNTGAETASDDTDWSESTIVPRRNLGFIQTTSLMLNGTIGAGVFITPGYVLALTRSKPIALVLWALGGVYTALRYVACSTMEKIQLICMGLSMLIYLEFGTALPFNGGALIYVGNIKIRY
jgi:hypothetical protein